MYYDFIKILDSLFLSSLIIHLHGYEILNDGNIIKYYHILYVNTPDIVCAMILVYQQEYFIHHSSQNQRLSSFLKGI